MKMGWRAVQIVFVMTLSALECAPQAADFSADARLTPTLEEACALAPVIVTARVERIFPSSELGRRLYTDALLEVVGVLKGPSNLSRLVVAESGGELGTRRQIPDYSMMRQGELYVLLLQPSGANSSDARFPSRGVNRYALFGSHLGRFRVDPAGVIRLDPGLTTNTSSPWNWWKYDRLYWAEFTSKIRECSSARPR